MPTTRAKFACNFVQPDAQTGGASLISLSPVYTGSEENKAFFASSPGGTIMFYCTNPAATAVFKQGKEYFVDFTPAESDSDGEVKDVGHPPMGSL